MLVKKAILFTSGVIFGSAGFKLLASKDAKKIYVKTLAAGLRGYDSLAKSGQKLQSDVEEIYSEAKQINEDRKSEETELEF